MASSSRSKNAVSFAFRFWVWIASFMAFLLVPSRGVWFVFPCSVVRFRLRLVDLDDGELASGGRAAELSSRHLDRVRAIVAELTLAARGVADVDVVAVGDGVHDRHPGLAAPERVDAVQRLVADQGFLLLVQGDAPDGSSGIAAGGGNHDSGLRCAAGDDGVVHGHSDVLAHDGEGTIS